MALIDIFVVIALFGAIATYIVQPGWLRGWMKKKEDPIEVERKVYEGLKGQLAEQKERTDNVVAIVQRREVALEEKKRKAAEIEREYLETPKENRDEAFEAEIGEKYARSTQSIREATAALAEARKLADDAKKVLKHTFESVQQFEEKFEHDQGVADLAAAHRFNAEAAEQAKGINSTLTAAGQASRDIAMDLEVGRAATDLAKGSKVEQERAALANGSDADDARAALRKLAENAEEVIVEVPAEANLRSSSGRF